VDRLACSRLVSVLVWRIRKVMTIYCRFSASHAADLFSMLNVPELPDNWTITAALTTPHVWDALILLWLLEDCIKHATQLVVSHDGDQQNRFRDAMKQRNERIILDGLPDVPHCCQKCIRFFPGSDGTMSK
jgi:hypothetical protein